MFAKTAALLAFVAIATATDINVVRRQDPITVAASVGGLAESIAALGTDAEVLSQQISGGTAITTLMTRTATNMQSDFAAETVIAAVLSAKVASLMTTVTAQERTYRNMLRDDLATSMAELNLNVAQLNSDAEVQTAEIASAVNSMTVEATAAQSTATAQMATLSDTLTRSVSTQMAAGTNAILAVNRTVSAGLVGKMNTRKHHWTGGCSGNRNGGWNWYCLDRIESDTSAPYFRKQNNDRFIASMPGLFRINFFTINNACGWAHAGLFVQGRWVTMTHMHVRYSWWKDTYNDATFRAANGHYFGVRTHASCGHTSSYHYSSHGRIEGSYVGVYQ